MIYEGLGSTLEDFASIERFLNITKDPGSYVWNSTEATASNCFYISLEGIVKEYTAAEGLLKGNVSKGNM